MLYSSVPKVGAIHPSLEGFPKGSGPGYLGKPSHQSKRGFKQVRSTLKTHQGGLLLPG